MSEDLTKKFPVSADEKLTLILSRIEKLEQTVEERLYDTRPIWHKVVADISQLQRGQDLLGAEVRSVRRDIDSRFGVIYGMLSEIQVDHRDLHARLTHLELNSTPPKPET